MRREDWWRYWLLAASVSFAIAGLSSMFSRSPRAETFASAPPRDPIAELYASELQAETESNPTIEPISGFGRAPEFVERAPEPMPPPDAAAQTVDNLANADRLTLVGDTDRDGVIAASDLADRDIWTRSRGAIVPVNLDDDDRDGRPDGLDRVLGNGDRDLAVLRLRLPASIAPDAKIRVAIDAASRPYANLFQRTARGWQIGRAHV